MKKLLPLLLALALLSPSIDARKRPEPPTAKVDSVNMWAIDLTPLKVDGRWYAVWSGWDDFYYKKECPVQNLYIAPMDFHKQKPYVTLGRRHLLSRPELPWELKKKEHIQLLEGPEALYHKGDIFIVYSTRGSWTKDYKLGALRFLGGDPLKASSWTKLPEPVFKGDEANGIKGVGHASFIKSPDRSEDWIYYHTKTLDQDGWGDRAACLQKFSFLDTGEPDFGLPEKAQTPLQRPSGEPEGTFCNPLHKGADPWMTFIDGKYYVCFSAKGGICVGECDFMTDVAEARKNGVKVWSPHGENSGAWNSVSSWAPELHHIDGRWYIFYTSGRQKGGPFWEHRSGVLVSKDGPFGPYEEHDDAPLFTGEVRQNGSPVCFADPYIYYEDGTYYLYGTCYDEGIGVLCSKDLLSWSVPDGGGREYALHRYDSFGNIWFWAPEVYKRGDKYVMFYSADQHICEAESESPEGPFRQSIKRPMTDENGIDSHLFIDDDGTPYLFWVRFEHGNIIYEAQLNEDLKTIKPESIRRCFGPEQPWEKIQARVNEGPFVIKHKRTYYLVYSANDYRSQDYALGYATATSPKGPWTKYEGNPVFRRPKGLVGVGHNSLFKDAKGRLMNVFHSHWSEERVAPRRTHIAPVSFRRNPSGGPDIMTFSEKYWSLVIENSPQ